MTEDEKNWLALIPRVQEARVMAVTLPPATTKESIQVSRDLSAFCIVWPDGTLEWPLFPTRDDAEAFLAAYRAYLQPEYDGNQSLNSLTGRFGTKTHEQAVTEIVFGKPWGRR